MHTTALVVIKSRKLLLAFSSNKQAFYLPGGKVDAGETAITALQREIAEELNVQVMEQHLHYYTHITAPAFGEQPGIIMDQDCYLYDLQETPVPSAEIGDLHYFNSDSYARQPKQVPGVVTIIRQLKQDGLID